MFNKIIGMIVGVTLVIMLFCGIWYMIVNDESNMKGKKQNELLWEISTLKLELQKIELQRKIKEAKEEQDVKNNNGIQRY